MCSVFKNFVDSGYIRKGYKTKPSANNHHENPYIVIMIIIIVIIMMVIIIVIIIIIVTLIGVWWGPSSPSPLQSPQTWQNTPSAPLQKENFSHGGQKNTF